MHLPNPASLFAHTKLTLFFKKTQNANYTSGFQPGRLLTGSSIRSKTRGRFF